MNPKILFVCARNDGRARMSAAFLNHLAGDRYEAISAGTEPGVPPRPEVVRAMAEDGVEIEDGPGTLLSLELARSAARVIAMGADLQTAFGALEVPFDQWGIPEPEGRPMPEVRVIRDTIRRLVERLVARLDTEAIVR